MPRFLCGGTTTQEGETLRGRRRGGETVLLASKEKPHQGDLLNPGTQNPNPQSLIPLQEGGETVFPASKEKPHQGDPAYSSCAQGVRSLGFGVSGFQGFRV